MSVGVDLGVLGFVERPTTPAQVAMAAGLRGRNIRLTRQECRIAAGLRQGWAGKRIAEEMGIQYGTWKVYKSKLHSKGFTDADLVLIGFALELSNATDSHG